MNQTHFTHHKPRVRLRLAPRSQEIHGLIIRFVLLSAVVIPLLVPVTLVAQEPTPAPPIPAPPTPAPPKSDPPVGEKRTSPIQGKKNADLTSAEIPNQRYPIAWRKNMRLAQKEAQERNVPLFIVVMRDADRISEATRASLWPNREYAELIDDECVPIVILLPPGNGEPPHAETPADPEKGVEAHCPLVPGQRCADHIAMTLRVKRDWRAGLGALPERRLISADGVVLAEPKDLPPGMSAEHFRAALPKVREALGERRATRVQHRFALVRLERMAEKISVREYRDASLDLRALKRDEAQLSAPILARANAFEQEIRKEAQRLLERARTLEEKNPNAAKQLYKVISEDFPGVPEGAIAQKKLGTGSPVTPPARPN